MLSARFIAAAAFAFGGCAAPPAAVSAPDLADEVTTLEASLRLPEGAGRLRTYDRYYWREGDQVMGEYRTGAGRVHLSRPRDMILDGGCSVVAVVYDPASGRAPEAACNGVA